MKRLWFGVGLLVLLLLLGAAVTVYAARTQEQVSSTLAKARGAALAGQWDTAAGLCGDAKAVWQRHRRLTASIADHEPMEEIESLFSQLEVYLQTRDPVNFAVCCASLEIFTHAIGEAQSISWWSIL